MIAKFGIFLALVCPLCCWAQTLDSKASLKVVKLTPPEYPPIATAAHVFGEVNLKIAINVDGGTKVVGVTGPEMLRKVAIESAEHSTFQPLSEDHNDELYELTYIFKLKFLDCGEAADSSIRPVQYMENAITITAQSIPICDPAADRRVRSAKCLYLWRCAWKTP